MTTNTDTAPIICRTLRQVDALVAERVMGWRWWRLLPCGFRSAGAGQYRILMDLPHEKAGQVRDAFPFVEPATGDELLSPNWDRDLPHYTTWAGLEAVISKVESARYWVSMEGACGLGMNPDKPDAALHPIGSTKESGYATGPSIPVALCLAALAAFGCWVQLELD